MREIKFRAWDKVNKVMHTWEQWWEEDKLECFLTVRKEFWEVMQYTGLKDKNGEEIYEGDILKIGNSNIEVIWDENNAWFTLKSNYFHLGFQSIFYEVIGNIYEHSHLLESEDK